MMKMVEQQVEEVRRLNKNKRQLTHQALNLIMVITSALMIWRGLMGWTLGESPIVVVLSGSMEPAFQRGDILFLDNNKPNLDIGDIVVFKIKDRDIPIVHRVLKVHTRKSDGVDFYLTKGDNNNVDDRGLYAPGQLWLQRGDIVGIARASIPYVGMATILMNDYPALKILAVGLMAIMAFTQRE
ncbi:signal peptidase I [Saprolegnia diclina VS20]|uniref:Signal peptidase complex catalytic subunit SEC11 n=1 Tax=Saprolegnia diclina (strain VS20) TaxID=1156394 RepID=T0Q272_SAPDV|nr:signal peptidase I [Saprolegnia diclina VS20]XP_008621360.1 signal peptidase I [Saprolegnia diclina VS20]EQC25216.1 signal peptidase I [Saprolegnia diclina VS20]EQC28661.1 signal peptidase I [Saprolegnia diclina VS20]|eukprot:XP_008617853.1 signal peptidase I [Saprolegnia diclina VS20]